MPLCALGAALLVVSQHANGQEPTAAKRPKIGLVLSGGGARGAAHVGVLKVLEELRIPVDLLAGNSMGSLVGGIYAYGYSPAEMEKILEEINWPQLLSDKSLREDRAFRRKQDDLVCQIDATFGFRDFEFVLPKGLVAGYYTGNLLKNIVLQRQPSIDFDKLRVPYRAVATDIVSGEQVVLASGDLARAMAASMAIPGAFAPVVIDGHQLVDGMVVNNVPIDIVKQMGADVVIAIDIGTPLLEAEQIRSLLNVTEQMIGILMQKNVDAQLAKLTAEDTLLQPDLGDITSTSFDRTAEAIAIGEKAARAIVERLRRYSVPEAEYRLFLERQRRPAIEYPIIDRIELENDSKLADAVVLALVETQVGERLDPARLQLDFDRIYGLEDFERVTFELHETTPGHAELKLITVAKPWGPNYVKFGLNLEDDFRGDAAYSLSVRYTMRTLNELGAEWRNEIQIGEPIRLLSEFYQPVDYATRWFVAPQVGYEIEEVNAFQSGVKVGEFDTNVGWIGADVGRNLGNVAQLRFGVSRAWGEVDPDITTTPIQKFSFDDGGLRASLEVDTLDNTHFPTAGWHATAKWSNGLEDLGADAEYDRLEATVQHAQTFGRNTFLLSADVGSAIDGTLPVYQLVTRGGFLNLSGFQRNELVGQAGAAARLIAYRRIAGTQFATFGMPVYVGGSIETGNVTDDRSELFKDLKLAGSLFVGSDTPLGPIYLGYGVAEGGNEALYFFIGQSF
ncbi:MAG TPA: patatin-like phospholipase family protein [Planctomycetota bacterium]